MEVVDFPIEEPSFPNPFAKDNMARQRRLAKAYREDGDEGLRRELEMLEKEEDAARKSRTSTSSATTPIARSK